MRRARLLMAALLALAALGVPAASAARKHSKRAKISRSVARASSERLVDAFRTVSPPSNPEDPGPEEPALPSFVSASAREFSLTLSRPLVGAGNVRIELRNNGEDPHNLVVSPEGTHTPLHARPRRLRAAHRPARAGALPALVLARVARGARDERHASRAVARHR
jgi:hypothetical protein